MKINFGPGRLSSVCRLIWMILHKGVRYKERGSPGRVEHWRGDPKEAPCLYPAFPPSCPVRRFRNPVSSARRLSRTLPLRSLRYVGADRLEVVPRHPLSDLVPEDGSLDDRGAVVHTVVDACVDDFLDDLVGAVEVMRDLFSRDWVDRCSEEVDAARPPLRAEELG